MSNIIKTILSAVDQTGGAFGSATRNMRGLQGEAGKLNSLLGKLGVGVSVAGLAAFAKSTIDSADGLQDMSERTGVAIKTLAGYKLAADQADTSLDSLAQGIQKLTLSIGQAEQGGKEQAAALQRLGVTARDPQLAFEQLADAVAHSNDPIKTNADLQKVLGKNYAELLPLLQGGAQGLRDSALASASFTEAMVKMAPEATKLNNSLDTLKSATAGFAGSILSEALPSINEWIKSTDTLIKRHGALLGVLSAIGAAAVPGITAGDLAGSVTSQAFRDKLEDAKKELAFIEATKKDAPGSNDVLQRKREYLKSYISGLESSISQFEKRQADARATATKTNPGTIDSSNALSCKPARPAKAAQGPIDVFENGSFVTSNKSVAESIRVQQEAINSLNKEMADEGVRAAEAFDSRLAALVSDTTLVKTKALHENIALLDNALFDGAIGAEQHAEALANLTGSLPDKLDKAKSIAEELGDAFTDTFESAGSSIRNVGDMLDTLRNKMASVFASRAGTYAANAITDFIFKPSADGNVFMNAPGLSAYSGSVVSSPTVFPFANGIGLMGEAGAEAILPLKRGRNGKLGVAMDGGGGSGGIVVQNTYHIDARGAEAGVEQRIRRAIDDSEDRAVSRAVTQVQSLNQRGQLRLS